MPNAFVFPGGVISRADFAQGWIDLFTECIPKSSLDCLSMTGKPRPFLMEDNQVEAVPRYVAFRLAALRETFEESGVLLLCPDSSGQIPVLSPDKCAEWRPKVHKDPSQMLELCRWLGAVPDIWTMAEWSDWLTPTGDEHGKRRFDTIFYTAHLPSMPQTLLDQAEVTAVEWEEPDAFLSLFSQKKLWLAPPQVYELSRMLHFQSQRELQEFAKKREKEGLETWLPIRVECSDGTLSLFPGDSMYPSSPDYVGDKTEKIASYPGTMLECRQDSGLLHRLEFTEFPRTLPSIHVTCKPALGHVHPKTNYL